MPNHFHAIMMITDQPRMDIAHPRMDTDQPRMDTDQSRMDTDQSRMDTDQPRMDTDQPRMDTDQPRMDTDQSRMDIDQPRMDIDQPRMDIDQPRRGGSRTAPTINEQYNADAINKKRKPLGRLIGAFKTVSTKKINVLRDSPGTPVWQRNYYEHIIRNPGAMDKIRQYIVNNPMSWSIDQLHPDNPSKW